MRQGRKIKDVKKEGRGGEIEGKKTQHDLSKCFGT